jgi:hypothetical protein
MVGMDVHHNPPKCKGGRNIPEHLYVYHNTLHSAVHENEFVLWARVGGSRGFKVIRELGVGIFLKENQIKGGLLTGPMPVWNDGRKQIKSWNHPGEGWVRGNMPHENSLASLSLGRHPWWNKDGVEKRSLVCPGPGWEAGRTKKPITPNFNYESSAQSGRKSMAQQYMDPDHPELGEKAAPVLVRMQKKRGYPHGPENRVRTE